MKPPWSAVLVLALVSCAKRPAPVEAEDASAMPTGSARALDEVPRPAPGAKVTSVSGVVVESLSLPSYTYLNLDTGREKVWAAVPRAEVPVGERVTVTRAVLMTAYRSAALGRDFDKVYFGVLAGAPSSGRDPHAGMSAAPTPSGAPVKVEKARGPGAKTIEEIARAPKTLEGKPVAVRGVVVKLNRGIMGKTWLHLADGTGSASDKTNDLLVTTLLDSLPKVGDTVLVRGKVATDRDFGSGYKYAVLIEAETIEGETR